MSIKNIYVNFFRYLKSPIVPQQIENIAKIKIFFSLFFFTLVIDFSLDWLSMNHLLINALRVIDVNAQDKEIYKDGFLFAILTVAILAPILEELIQRSYLTSFAWNNYLVPINISLIVVLIFNIRGYILFGIFGISLIISYIFYLILKKNQKIKFKLLKFYSKNFGLYFYLSAISFGVAHLTNYNITRFIPVLPLLLVLSQIFAGLMLGYIRISMGLRWSIFFHILHNLILLIFLFIKNLS